jgi:hypothetical protein
MAEEFTLPACGARWAGLRARWQARSHTERVIVGRDPRFLGETFCSIATEILERHGITPAIVAEAVPTPAFAYAVVQTEADGVIHFTASHNPPQYNGIKFSTPDGCPALPEVTSKIEAEIEAEDRSGSLSGAESSGNGSARESLDVKQVLGPCTMIGACCLADMHPSRMITCWKTCAIRCGRRERRLVLRLTVMRIGLELWMGTELCCSRTT